MFCSLFPLALQGVKRKKRISSLVFYILLISFGFSLVSLSLVGSISKTNANLRLGNYGAWYYAIPSGLEEDAAWLQKQSWADSVGTARVYGQSVSSTFTASFGTMDKTLIDMGQIRLDAGRWPAEDGEVAIESHILRLLGLDDTLGQSILLPIASNPSGHAGGTETTAYATKSLTLCGVIHDYTNLWILTRNRDFRHPVSIVVTEATGEYILQGLDRISQSQSYQAPKAVPQYYISVSQGHREEAGKALSAYLTQTRTGDFGDQVPCENKIAYPELSEASYETIYSYVIAGVALVAVLCAYIIQLPTEAKAYATLRGIGITKGQLAVLLLTEAMLLCIPAMVLGIPLGILLTKLSLKLLLYSGSAAIQVTIPEKALLAMGGLWIFMVFLARMIALLVTIRTPLVGKFQLDARKARNAKRFRSALIGFFLVCFGFVVTFTANESAWPVFCHQYWQSMYSYDISKYKELVFDTDLEQLAEVPGIRNVYGFSEVNAMLSFDGMDEKIPVWLYAMDEENWDDVFDFGKDAAQFRSGELCILCLPDDGQDYDLPRQSVTIYGGQKPDAPTAVSAPTSFSVRKIGENVNNNGVSYIFEPYTVIVSHQYMKNLLSTMEDKAAWGGFSKNTPYGYQRCHAFADNNANDLSTDVVLTDFCKRNDLSVYNRRADNAALIQTFSQRLIFLYTAGGSIALILIMVLGSTLALETEQEIRRYRTLRVIGMSRRQMRHDVLRKAALRGAVSPIAGWIFFDLYRVFAALREEGTGMQDALTVLQHPQLAGAKALALSAGCFLAVFLVSIFAKRKLGKEVDQL